MVHKTRRVSLGYGREWVEMRVIEGLMKRSNLGFKPIVGGGAGEFFFCRSCVSLRSQEDLGRS